MEQIFAITTKYHQLRDIDMSEVNKFLTKNPHYIVKNIVPVTQHGGNDPNYYGVVITVGEK